ncbi:jg27011, partial [Pararge aegeria aegeria]
ITINNKQFRHQSSVTVSQDPASSSHQRLLALSHADVERRLIDNKSLLTIVDKPALRQLPTLVASLAARVESDKAVLACVGQIKRSDPTLDLSDTR